MAAGVTEMRLDGGPTAPARARRELTELLEGRLAADQRDAAVLLTSELVTNAVVHGDVGETEPVFLDVEPQRSTVRIAVTHRGHGFGPDDAPHIAAGGYGLRLVEKLATRWGIGHNAQTTVWFELRSI